MITSNQIETIKENDYLPKGSPAQRLRNIMLSQPSAQEQELYNKRMIEEIEDDAKAQVDENDYNLVSKPNNAVYETELRVMERINSVMPKKIPTGNEVISNEIPELIFTDDGSMQPTAESVHKRVERLKVIALNLIGTACINGATIPRYDFRNGKELPLFSIPVLETSVQFLNSNQ